MSTNKYNRKEFFTYLGKLLGKQTMGKIIPDGDTSDAMKLSDKEINFLTEYSIWLKEFNKLIKNSGKTINNTEHNKRLMELSEEAEIRKPALEEFMMNEVFAAYYLHITKNISALIK